MMFLSMLLIDTGTNPDRPRPGRLWLRNRYRVHQRLCMGFPSRERKTADAQMLQPFNPKDFGQGHVHVQRGREAGFLFRVDPLANGRAAVIVSSALEPDWAYAFHNAQHLLAGPPQTKPFEPKLQAGQRLRFRLMVNPVFRARSQSTGADGQPIRPDHVGKRIAVPGDEDSLRQWLKRRAAGAGFELADDPGIQTGYIHVARDGDLKTAQRLRSVRYDGLLEVIDPARFLKTLSAGIGPAKAFGFGLLSIAPAG